MLQSVALRYTGAEDDSAITLAFSKTKINERKEWLTNFMQVCYDFEIDAKNSGAFLFSVFAHGGWIVRSCLD